ncbi:hypothetical protein CTRI78_v006652 [Colletotrichum trifolii]|uniref:Uncharacterized protein n=1 Tax=Colletotrichum trifolii TaxID=5466 RepID=A0A4R8RGJ4_COLTR|nr:hypothetical protein CTRI78_v006652 [Colletotrichum trifolii]
MKPIQLTLAALFAPGVLAEDAWVRDCDFISFATAGIEPWLHCNCESPAPPRQSCSLVSLKDCFVNDRGTLRAQHGHASSGGVLTSTNVDTAIKPIGASRIGCFGVRSWTSCDP